MTRKTGYRVEGFTLLELVAVIVILSVALVPVTGLFSKASLSMLSNQRIQVATQLAQEQAERILGQRRTQGFTPTAMAHYPPEILDGNYVGFRRATTITQTLERAGCPDDARCALVNVSVGSADSVLSEITFVLVDY